MLLGTCRINLRFILSLWVGCQACPASQPDPLASLQAQYRSLEVSLQSNQYHAPINITSQFQGDTATGEVYAVLDHEFTHIGPGLNSATRWCDVLLLHVNVKGCVVQHAAATPDVMQVYVGRDYYQSTDDAYSMQYTFSVPDQRQDYFQMNMTAADGPLGTSDYLMSFEAIPISDNKTFMHLKYAYQYGLLARLMLKGYLATLGRNKVGFSVKEYDEHHQPVYVQGIQGIVERNSMRYFLAIQAYLDTQDLDSSQWASRINHWYRLAVPFGTQLTEIEDKKYLKSKQQQFKLSEQDAVSPSGSNL